MRRPQGPLDTPRSPPGSSVEGAHSSCPSVDQYPTYLCTGGVLELWDTTKIAVAAGSTTTSIRDLAGTRNTAGAVFPAPVATVGDEHGWQPGQADDVVAWFAGSPLPDTVPPLVVYLTTGDVAALTGRTVRAVQMAVWRARNTTRPDPIPRPDVEIQREAGARTARVVGWLPARRSELRRWRSPATVADAAPLGVVTVGLAHLARALKVQPRIVRDWYEAHRDDPDDPFPQPDTVTGGCEYARRDQPGWLETRVPVVAAWTRQHQARMRAGLAAASAGGGVDPVVTWREQGRSWQTVASLTGLSSRGARLRYQQAMAATGE